MTIVIRFIDLDKYFKLLAILGEENFKSDQYDLYANINFPSSRKKWILIIQRSTEFERTKSFKPSKDLKKFLDLNKGNKKFKFYLLKIDVEAIRSLPSPLQQVINHALSQSNISY